MSCCPQTSAPLTARHRMQVRYLGGRPVLIKGPVTGIVYRFSGIDRVQLVDPRDAITMVRAPLFRVEGVVEISGPQAVPSNDRSGDDA